LAQRHARTGAEARRLFDSSMQFVATLFRSAPVAWLVSALAHELREREIVFVGRIEQIFDEVWTNDVEALLKGETSMDDSMREELAAREARLRQLGIEPYPNDLDEALVQLRDDMESWERESWRLPTPQHRQQRPLPQSLEGELAAREARVRELGATPRPQSATKPSVRRDLPDELDVELRSETPRHEERSAYPDEGKVVHVEGSAVRRALDSGRFCLTEIRDGQSTRYTLTRVRGSQVRAFGSDGRLMEER
jgi:hypothetical protein